MFYAAFNSISVISRRQLTLLMLSWVSPVLGWALSEKKLYGTVYLVSETFYKVIYVKYIYIFFFLSFSFSETQTSVVYVLLWLWYLHRSSHHLPHHFLHVQVSV